MTNSSNPSNASGGTHPLSDSGPDHNKPLDEEPELTQESDVPLDGRDEEGEDMIRDLPKPVEKPESSQ